MADMQRNFVGPAVLKYGKKLNPDQLPYAWMFYNSETNDMVYISQENLTIVDVENYELVETNYGDSIWIILPLSATSYVYYRKSDVSLDIVCESDVESNYFNVEDNILTC